MRILFTCNPMMGHLNTILPLARAARRAGHEVVVATGPDAVPHVERWALTAWPVGPTHAEAGGRAGLSVEYFIAAAEKRALDLVPATIDWGPDLVVHEEIELAGPVAAAAAGARHVVHGLGLMPPPSVWTAVAPIIDRLGLRWDVPDLAAAVRDATYLDVCPPALHPDGEAVWRRDQPIRPLTGAAVVGERLPEAMAALPHPVTVHLTLGTVFHETAGALETALAGLRELPANLVVTSGPGTDPARFGPQPAHVLIAPYLPHTLLLPRCALVVSHGGAGILFGALAHGLPQLVLPQGADQFLNADACRRAGAGLVLAPGEVTAAAVADAARMLLAEHSFTAAAQRVRAEIEAMPSPDAVLAALTGEMP
jgi:UDP:flavonoid glycosyltransferase YjiC (YdhE family)